MAVMSDWEIKKRANRSKMIEPFWAENISKRTDDPTQRAISYGLSSYGYDATVGDRFLVYHNALADHIDPKNFNEDSFLVVEGKGYVMVPPNSFVLCETVEYFRIPRICLPLVMAKSTYARCFSGSTKIALVDGTSISFSEAVNSTKPYWGYGLTDNGFVNVVELSGIHFTGMDKLLELTLDDGSVIQCTSDHEFVLNNSWYEVKYKQAMDLRPGDSLRPLYRKENKGYEYIYINGKWLPTHMLADEWNLKHGVYERMLESERHHIDMNKRNNNPWNLMRMPSSDHRKFHNELYFGDDFDPELHGKQIREGLDELYADEERFAAYCEQQRQRAVNFWNDSKYEDARSEHIRRNIERLQSAEYREHLSSKLRTYYNNPEVLKLCSERSKEAWETASDERRNRQREIARQLNRRDDLIPDNVRLALQKAGTLNGAAKLLDADPSVFRRSDLKPIVDAFRETSAYANHKIVKIKELKGEHETYCLQSETGNFALEAGVFVHNCGLVVNATVLEPEWEGTITLELSNTTPLPIKVYANEGIVQIVFLKGDTECESSYADKKGKYQNQRGVTPPHMGE